MNVHGPYFFCANDVTDLASVKGRKVRTAGTAQNRSYGRKLVTLDQAAV